MKKAIDNKLSVISETAQTFGAAAFYAAGITVVLGAPMFIGGALLSATTVASGLTIFGLLCEAFSLLAGLTSISTGLSKQSLDGRTLSDEESQTRIQEGIKYATNALVLMAEGVYLSILINKNNNSSGNSSSNNNNVDDQNRPKEIVYRGDSSSNNPSKVFENGFNSKGTNNDLMSHVKHSESGNYVSTLKNLR